MIRIFFWQESPYCNVQGHKYLTTIWKMSGILWRWIVILSCTTVDIQLINNTSKTNSLCERLVSQTLSCRLRRSCMYLTGFLLSHQITSVSLSHVSNFYGFFKNRITTLVLVLYDHMALSGNNTSKSIDDTLPAFINNIWHITIRSAAESNNYNCFKIVKIKLNI